MEQIFYSADLPTLEEALRKDDSLANLPIALPGNPAKAHPLHRICDAIFLKHFNQNVGIQIASLYFKYGADVNPLLPPGKDSPLTAACSLRCDSIAKFYIDKGASISHQGCHGGTALHWAAWCGRDEIIEKILPAPDEINRLCLDFKSTPLFWAIHGYTFGGSENLHHQKNCARLLMENGADPSITNFEGYMPVQLLKDSDSELIEILSR